LEANNGKQGNEGVLTDIACSRNRWHRLDFMRKDWLRSRHHLSGDDCQRHNLLNRSEFQRLGGGVPIIVTVLGLPYPLVLIRVDAETFRAVLAKCTHLGCHVRPSKSF